MKSYERQEIFQYDAREMPQKSEGFMFNEYLLPWAESLPAGLILDLAGGTGVDSKLLSEYGFDTFVTDLSFSMLAAEDSQNRVQADAEFLPFADETFAGVIFKDIWVFLDPNQRLTVLNEICRVLKNGGSIFLMSQFGSVERIFYIPLGSQYPQKEVCSSYEDSILIYEKLESAGDNIFSVEHISTPKNTEEFARQTGFESQVLTYYSFDSPLAKENRWVQRAGFIAKLTKDNRLR